MIDGENPFHPPATSIGVQTVPRRRPLLRWSAAVLCGLCSIIPFFATYLLTDVINNQLIHDGWRQWISAPPGPVKRIVMLFCMLVIATSGVLFLLAGRCFVIGRARRAFLWTLAAIVAGCFIYFPFNARL